MNNPTNSPQLDSFVFEGFRDLRAIYELRRTLELEVKGEPVRIEIWYWHSNPRCQWVAYVHTRVDKLDGWRRWPEFPWVEERDETTAIHQALTFLEERIQ